MLFLIIVNSELFDNQKFGYNIDFYDKSRAWWLSQSRLTALLASLIARRCIRTWAIRRLQPKPSTAVTQTVGF